MKVTLEIEQEDLREMYSAYKLSRFYGWCVQDCLMQLKMDEQEKRIKALVEPLLPPKQTPYKNKEN